MNIDRLMQDLTVEQLEEIQSSLNHEVEKKKEDLRQMVGRRYRDVLQAANAVKRLTEISDQILSQVQTMKASTLCVIDLQHQTTVQKSQSGKRISMQQFILLNSLMPTIGYYSDGLSNVFALLLAENLHRSVILSASNFGEASVRVVNSYGNQLINYRIRLNDLLIEELGELFEWSAVAGQLMAIAFLKHLKVKELLRVYLAARQQNLLSNIRILTSIGVIQIMRETMTCVDQVFGRGQGLESAYKTMSAPGWCPETLVQHMEDQPYVYTKLFSIELAKINQIHWERFQELFASDVEVLLSDWIINLCLEARQPIREMCERFDLIVEPTLSPKEPLGIDQFGRATEQLVEFAEAIDKVFKTSCSPIVSNQIVYRALFCNSLLDRWQKLIDDEVVRAERELRTQLLLINCNPPPLFHKRATKFDGLLAAGVSHELHALTHKFNQRLQSLMQRVERYVQLGYDENVEIVRNYLSNAVMAALERLTKHAISDFDNKGANKSPRQLLPSEENQRWLKEFRLYLALVQYEPSIISHCMFDNVERAVKANNMLREAAETALWQSFSHLMDYIIEEAVQDSELNKMSLACADTAQCLDYVQVSGRIVLNSETGSAVSVQVPTQLSKQLFDFLYQICRRVSQNSFSHLFTRNVSVYVSDRLASILSTTIDQCAAQLPTETVFAAQLIIDARILHQMFPHTRFVEAVEALRTKIDLFEWNIIDSHLAQNARIAVKRCTMLFGQLQVDDNSSIKSDDKMALEVLAKDAQDQPLVDIMPRMEKIPRLSTIPRLTKLKEEEKNQRTIGAQAASKRADSKNLNFSVDGFFNYFMSGKNQ